MATLIRVDKNGTKYYEGLVTCNRCGGAGCANQWAYTGYTCYECGGRGKVIGKWKEYTPEYEAKLAERRRKRAEKYLEEHEQEIREREEARAKEEAEKKAEQERKEAEERAEKAKSQYYGNVGDKIEVKAIYKFSAWYECKSFAGYGTETHYIHTFKVGDDTLVWKTTNGLGDIEKETEVTLKGTIKEHTEYREEKQTILTRCKVTK
jgi:hypothetical protein